MKPSHQAIFIDVELLCDLCRWFAGSPMSDSLRDFSNILSLTRTHELSVEGLHRSGILVSRAAPRHDAAHLSHSLRVEECVRHHGLGPMATLMMTMLYRHIADHVQLAYHPTLAMWQHHLLVDQSVRESQAQIGRGGSYGLLRECVYHASLHDIYFVEAVRHDVDGLKRHRRPVVNTMQQLKDEEASDLCEVTRLLHGSALQSEDVVNACVVTYASLHFQYRLQCNGVLVFPKLAVESMARFYAPSTIVRLLAGPDAIAADELQADAHGMDWLGLNMADSVFKVVDPRPKRRCILPNQATSTRVIAVEPQVVVAKSVCTRCFCSVSIAVRQGLRTTRVVKLTIA